MIKVKNIIFNRFKKLNNNYQIIVAHLILKIFQTLIVILIVIFARLDQIKKGIFKYKMHNIKKKFKTIQKYNK